jgi:uncharacterized membrane protein (DUF2068 family)
VPIRYELLACALTGHTVVGEDAGELRPSDDLVVRDGGDGLRWHRCLRCDAWLPRPVPEPPGRPFPPDLTDDDVPPRGKLLRDRYVLRLIALDRLLHTVALGLLAAATIWFVLHREGLNQVLVEVLNTAQESLSGRPGIGLVHGVQNAFTMPASTLWGFAAVFVFYAVLEGVEAVGLWYAKRWAEYLTFVATTLLLFPEGYELSRHVTVLKVLALVVNLAVIAYLLWAKRLFGVNGGGRAEHEERLADVGLSALRRAHPFPLPAEPAPSARPAEPAQPGHPEPAPGPARAG